MEHLFFYLDEGIEKVMKAVFEPLSLKDNVREGDSSNVKDGVYYICTVFGVNIKLEGNSYDYDDKFNYMITVEQDLFSNIEADAEIIKNVTLTVRKILALSLKIPIALEIDNYGLELF